MHHCIRFRPNVVLFLSSPRHSHCKVPLADKSEARKSLVSAAKLGNLE